MHYINSDTPELRIKWEKYKSILEEMINSNRANSFFIWDSMGSEIKTKPKFNLEKVNWKKEGF